MVGFEYWQVNFILPTPFWILSPDDNMDNWAIELAAIELAVFIVKVKQKIGRVSDVFAHSKGSTIFVKAAKWIARIQEATRQGKDVATYLRSLPEWYCINIEVATYLRGSPAYLNGSTAFPLPEQNFAHHEEKLLLDNFSLIQKVSIGTAVVAGSPANVHDPEWQYLQEIVEKRTPPGNPAVFYIWSNNDIVVRFFFLDTARGIKPLDGNGSLPTK